ncbi:MAG: hypothetical protein DDT19_02867 [Syntrophomonadaceae bacterium]|nr:hypothetical protein [Bacillota bacterium]
MNRYYTLKEVKAIRGKISRLGERNSPQLEAKLSKAREKLSKARAKWGRAHAKWSKARAGWDVKLFTLLIPICPEAHYHDWNGYLAIPKDDNENWIIPVFTGNYKDMKHKAFSIWTILKYSYDMDKAVEVKGE